MKTTTALLLSVTFLSLSVGSALAATAKCTVTEIKDSIITLDCGKTADKLKVDDQVKVKTAKKKPSKDANPFFNSPGTAPAWPLKPELPKEATMRTGQFTLLFAIAMLVFMVLPAQSRNLYPDDINVEVVSDQRGSLREYPTHPDSKWRRTYIEAQKDERYRIRVRNNTDRRIGIVIAVDGRNIISGKRSNLKHNEAMYVLNPWQTTEYSGWRTSRNQEHRFYFTRVDDSYADAWGDRSAMGVIAVAAFPEKWQEPRPEFDRPFGRRSAPMGSMKRGRNKAPGTGFGEGNWSPSHEVNFVARHRPFMKKFIKYEWRKTLCRRGIIECQRNRRHAQPRNRFWPEEKDSDRGFAPFPPPVNNLLRQLLPIPW